MAGSKYFKSTFVYCVYVSVCTWVIQSTHEGQKTTCGSQFSVPSYGFQALSAKPSHQLTEGVFLRDIRQGCDVDA